MSAPPPVPFREPPPHTVIDHAPPVVQPGQAVVIFSPRKVAAFASAAFCILAGLYLLMVEPADKDNKLVLFSIAHGMGAYFVGKGIYCGTELWGPAVVIAPPVRMGRRLPPAARVALWVVGMAAVVAMSMVAGLVVRANVSPRARDYIDFNVEGH
jgi:hypothetical protein